MTFVEEKIYTKKNNKKSKLDEENAEKVKENKGYVENTKRSKNKKRSSSGSNQGHLKKFRFIS